MAEHRPEWPLWWRVSWRRAHLGACRPVPTGLAGTPPWHWSGPGPGPGPLGRVRPVLLLTRAEALVLILAPHAPSHPTQHWGGLALFKPKYRKNDRSFSVLTAHKGGGIFYKQTLYLVSPSRRPSLRIPGSAMAPAAVGVCRSPTSDLCCGDRPLASIERRTSCFLIGGTERHQEGKLVAHRVEVTVGAF